MITEDYISFETAKLLKEKGFDCECSCYYFFNDNEQFEESLSHWNWNNGYTFRYSAPTIQMAMKWLREVHNIHINLDIHWLYFANALGWIYIITKIFENGVDYVEAKGDEDDKTFYSTYEEACEAAIKYCLKNLI